MIQTFKAPGMPVLWGPHNWAYVAGYLFNVPGLQPLKHAWMQHCLWIHELNAAKFSCHFTGNNFFNMICNWETTKMLMPFFSCYRHMWALKWSFCDSFCYIIGHISFFLGNWFCFHGMNVCICCYQNDSRFWRQEESHVLLIF